MTRLASLVRLLGRAALAASATLVGCTVVNDPAEHLSEPVPTSRFCSEYAATLCGDALDCCLDGLEIPEDTRALCATFAGNTCNGFLASVVNDPRSGYDPQEAGRLLAVGRQLGARCDAAGFVRWLGDPDGVFAALTGTVDRGGDCGPAPGEDPADGLSARFFSCRDGLACRPFPSPERPQEWRCEEPVGPGGSCLLGAQMCQRDLSCSEGVCEARLPPGSPCGSNESCSSLACAGGISMRDDPGGRCLPDEGLFCRAIGWCADDTVNYIGEAGPLFEGFECASVTACVDDLALERDLEALGWNCGPRPGCTGTRCAFDRDGRLPAEGPGRLDDASALFLCSVAGEEAVSRLTCSDEPPGL